MKIFDSAQRFLFNQPSGRIITIVFLLALIKSGVWFIPNIGMFLAVAQDPFVNPFPDPEAHYLFWSWLTPFIAWAINAQTNASFLLLHLVFTFGFIGVFVSLIFRRLPPQEARKSFVFFMTLPVAMTGFYWVGPDGMTLLLLAGALAAQHHRSITFLIGLLLGMQHFEQGFIASGALLFSLLLSRHMGVKTSFSITWASLLLAGTVAGKMFLITLFTIKDIEITSGRLFWLQQHWAIILKQFAYHFQTVLWSLLGLGWLLVIRLAEDGKKFIPFLLALLGLLLLTPISGDQTRVLAIVTFPLVAVHLLLDRDFLMRVESSFTALLFVLWLLMPWAWVWGGVARGSAFSFDVALVLHYLFGWVTLPDNIATWPF